MFNFLRGLALFLVILFVNTLSLQAEVLYGEKLDDDWIWFAEKDNEQNYKFEGEIRKGEPDGQGTLTLPNGSKYVVEFKNGKFKEVSTKETVVEEPVIVESVVEAPKAVVVEVEAPKAVVVEAPKAVVVEVEQ